MKVITKTLSPMWEALELLPPKVRYEVQRFADARPELEERITEIRLRRAGRVSVTVDRDNVTLPVSLTKDEIELTLKNLCDGSVYAHSDTINNGYISLKNGTRVGVVGRAVCSAERIDGVCDISALNIRIPRDIYGLGAPIFEEIKKRDFLCGVLIYSAPGVGKTTLLRSLIYELSKTKRVAVIDTREELDIPSERSRALVDVLSGYPKAKGIEIATRTLSPQYIVCDEIGADEAKTVLASHSGGVPLIATAHALSCEALVRREGIKSLYEAGIFDIFAGITRKNGAHDYIYDIKYSGDTL